MPIKYLLSNLSYHHNMGNITYCQAIILQLFSVPSGKPETVMADLFAKGGQINKSHGFIVI